MSLSLSEMEKIHPNMSYPGSNVVIRDDEEYAWTKPEYEVTGNAYCDLIDSHFYLYSYWWVVIILQLLSPFTLPLVLYSCIEILFEACGIKDCLERIVGLSINNMLTLLVQGSFWIWAGYLISVWCCQTPEPMIITAIVFLILSYIINLTLLFTTGKLSEDAAVMNKATPEDYHNYLERTRNMSPRYMIKGKSYHREQISHQRGRYSGRPQTVKVFSYEGDEIFHYDKWLDLSDWGTMSDINTSGKYMTIVTFSFESQPGDEYTQVELDNFISNYKQYVQDLDERTSSFKVSHQIMTGHDRDSFREVFVKQEKAEEGDTDDDDDKEKGVVEEAFSEESSNTFSIINPNMAEPWYMSKTLLIITTFLAVSLFQKMLVSLAARKHHFNIKKVYFSDPSNPFTEYSFVRNPVVPYTGPGRGHMPLLSSMVPGSGRQYEKANVTVEQKPAVLDAKKTSQKSQSKSGTAVVSFYDDVSQMPGVQNF